MKLTRNRHYETLTYIGLWLLVIALYMLVTIRNRSMDSLTPVNEEIFVRMAMTLTPFVVLFRHSQLAADTASVVSQPAPGLFHMLIDSIGSCVVLSVFPLHT